MQLLDVIPEFCRKPVLVLGCGNVLFGDDGFGPAVVQRLEEELPAASRGRICLLDVGTGARGVLFTLALSEVRPERLIVVDAVDAGRPPGELFTLPLDQMPAPKLDDFSMHQVPTSNLLRELRDARGVSVEILCCQVARIPETVAPGLSDAVRDALPAACRAILNRTPSDDPARDDGRRPPEGGSQRSPAAPGDPPVRAV